MGVDCTDPSRTVLAEEHSDESSVQGAGALAQLKARSVARGAPILLTLVGGCLQGYANGTFSAPLAAVLFLLAGYGIAWLVFPRMDAEARAFALTYGMCVFVGGVAQCYSLRVFGEIQSTNDAMEFFSAVFPQPPYFGWSELQNVIVNGAPVSRGAPLAVAIWQWVYRLRLVLGLDYGVYIGVMFNAFVMGLAGGITVRTAREVFGEDGWRLRRVGTLFAFCGLFILFGSVLLRDCFTTFFNALVLWGLVRWLCRPTPKNLVFAAALTLLSMGAMAYLRSRSLVLFGLFWFVAFVCWFMRRRFNAMRLGAVVVGLVVLVFASSYFLSYMVASRELQSQNLESYAGMLADSSQEDSLAMQFLVHQPLPIRLVLGTGSRMIFPIPLWAYFHEEASEYHLIKGYHGLFQVLVMPLVFAGFLAIPRKYRKDRKAAIPMLFLALYLIMNVEAVMATSLEQRHIAQFMPAFFILAAIPDTRERKTQNTVQVLAAGWLAVVVVVHFAWFVLK